MKLSTLNTLGYVSLTCGLLASCRSEKATFYFRAPQPAVVRQLPAPATTVPPVSGATTVAKPQSQTAPTARPAATKAKRTAATHIKQLAQLPLPSLPQAARLRRQLTHVVARPATEHARKAALSSSLRVGLILLGMGLLVLLSVAVLASTVATFEGIIFLLVGYYLGIGLLLAGLVMLLVAAIAS